MEDGEWGVERGDSVSSFVLRRPTLEVGYDECREAVVRARDEAEARRVLAQESRWFEPPGVWLDPTKSTCEVVDGEPEVIVLDVKDGG